jgi:hypothetical protein
MITCDKFLYNYPCWLSIIHSVVAASNHDTRKRQQQKPLLIHNTYSYQSLLIYVSCCGYPSRMILYITSPHIPVLITPHLAEVNSWKRNKHANTTIIWTKKNTTKNEFWLNDLASFTAKKMINYQVMSMTWNNNRPIHGYMYTQALNNNISTSKHRQKRKQLSTIPARWQKSPRNKKGLLLFHVMDMTW